MFHIETNIYLNRASVNVYMYVVRILIECCLYDNGYQWLQCTEINVWMMYMFVYIVVHGRMLFVIK